MHMFSKDMSPNLSEYPVPLYFQNRSWHCHAQKATKPTIANYLRKKIKYTLETHKRQETVAAETDNTNKWKNWKSNLLHQDTAQKPWQGSLLHSGTSLRNSWKKTTNPTHHSELCTNWPHPLPFLLQIKPVSGLIMLQPMQIQIFQSQTEHKLT